ncbi:MAG: hypothetical protein KF726_12695 [Anaerolineae bacterium]|nr:hypothetical protein [Anaerolineae bacterium]
MTEANVDVQMASPSQPKQGGSLLRSRAVRLVIGLIAAVAVIAIAVVLIFQQMRSSRSQPLEYKSYPGMALVNRSQGNGTDYAIFSVGVPVKQVIDFYVAEYGADPERGCVLLPSTEDVQAAKCIVDNSQDNITQRLLLDISFDPAAQKTMITIERDWGQ